MNCIEPDKQRTPRIGRDVLSDEWESITHHAKYITRSKAMEPEELCNCFEYAGDNPDCPIHHPKNEENKQGEQE